MKFWYAVMESKDDTDWGYGSHDLDKAIEMLKSSKYRNGYIVKIDESEDSVAVEEIQPFETRYAVIDDRGTDLFTDWYASLEDANDAARDAWESDRIHHIYVVDVWEGDLQTPGDWDSFDTCGFCVGRFDSDNLSDYTVSGTTYPLTEDGHIDYGSCVDTFEWDNPVTLDSRDPVGSAAPVVQEEYECNYCDVETRVVRADGLNYSKDRLHVFYTEDGEDYCDVVEVW